MKVAKEIKQYRPISLVSSVCKIILKVLANRTSLVRKEVLEGNDWALSKEGIRIGF